MNLDIEELLSKLTNQVTELHHRWMIYREVYASSSEDIELINRHGPNFFHYTQHLMLDNIALTFSKLTDPNSQRKNLNLSLKQFHVYASENSDLELIAALKEKFEVLFSACQKFRDLRNKRIAHADLLYALEKTEEPLAGVSRQYIETALELLRDYINTVQLHYKDSSTAYEYLVTSPSSGGEGVLQALRLSEQNEKNL